MRVNNVSSTHTATASSQLSRHELLAWVNKTLQSRFTKVDELCTGAAYCQLMDSLFPKIVPLKRVKFYTNLEHEFIDNFKILQMVFQKLRVQKAIPIDRLVRGKFQDNIEFLQWFKTFYDANYVLRIYDPVGVRNGQPMGYGSALSKKKSPKINSPKSNVVVVSGGGGGGGQRTYRKKSPVKIQNNEANHELKKSLTRTELRHNFPIPIGGTNFENPNIVMPNAADLPIIQLKNSCILDVKNSGLQIDKTKPTMTTTTVSESMESKLERILACCEEAKANGELGLEIDMIMHIILGSGGGGGGGNKADRLSNELDQIAQLGAGDFAAEDKDVVEVKKCLRED